MLYCVQIQKVIIRRILSNLIYKYVYLQCTLSDMSDAICVVLPPARQTIMITCMSELEDL